MTTEARRGQIKSKTHLKSKVRVKEAENEDDRAIIAHYVLTPVREASKALSLNLLNSIELYFLSFFITRNILWKLLLLVSLHYFLSVLLLLLVTLLVVKPVFIDNS